MERVLGRRTLLVEEGTKISERKQVRSEMIAAQVKNIETQGSFEIEIHNGKCQKDELGSLTSWVGIGRRGLNLRKESKIIGA